MFLESEIYKVRCVWLSVVSILTKVLLFVWIFTQRITKNQIGQIHIKYNKRTLLEHG